MQKVKKLLKELTKELEEQTGYEPDIKINFFSIPSFKEGIKIAGLLQDFRKKDYPGTLWCSKKGNISTYGIKVPPKYRGDFSNIEFSVFFTPEELK